MKFSLPLRRSGALAASMAVLALALTSCGAGSTAADSTADGLLASVDTNFGVVEVPVPDDGELTVVALGWSDGEVALSLGVKPVAIFDWQSFGAENKGVGAWATEDFGDVVPELIERGDESVNYEQIQALNPDVILNVRAALDEKVNTRLSEIAPTISAPSGTADYAVEWRTHTAVIAEALGKVDEGKKLVAGLDAKFADARTAHPEFDGVEFVSGSKFGAAYGASLPGDARFDMYGDLGFVLAPAVAALPAPDGFFAAISVEQVTALDTQVAALTTIGLPIEDLSNDPLIKSLDVIKDGRTLLLDPKGPAMTGATAGTVESIGLALDTVVPLLADAVAKLP